jgi:GNAT superfamily N-acetyltransferase
MGTILRWSDITNPQTHYDSLAEIFFLTSGRKAFQSESEKLDFLQTWTAIYLQYYPSYTFLSLSASGLLEGYLTGCPDTASYQLRQQKIPYLNIFADSYTRYPAHLHINCHPDHQGKGVGRRLIESYVALLAQEKVPGVHILTSVDAANINFYRALAFSHTIVKTWKNSELLLMGRDILI